MLWTANAKSPLVVNLALGSDELIVSRGEEVDSLPLSSLRIVSSSDQAVRLKCKRVHGWDLQVSGLLARHIREQVPARNWAQALGESRFAHVLFFVATLLMVELVKLPVEWIAPIVPARFEQMLLPQEFRGEVGEHCRSPEGKRAVHRLLAKFDPEIARSIKVDVYYDPSFLVTALPGNELIILNPILVEANGDQLAALLAHEVAHIRRGDTVRATLRAQGTLGALIGNLFGARRPEGLLKFTPEEERAADLDAVAMLLKARISPIPGAEFYELSASEREANRSFGKEQYFLHYGLGEKRGKIWRDIPDPGQLAQVGPAFTPAEEDALFNYCLTKDPYVGPPESGAI